MSDNDEWKWPTLADAAEAYADAKEKTLEALESVGIVEIDEDTGAVGASEASLRAGSTAARIAIGLATLGASEAWNLAGEQLTGTSFLGSAQDAYVKWGDDAYNDEISYLQNRADGLTAILVEIDAIHQSGSDHNTKVGKYDILLSKQNGEEELRYFKEAFLGYYAAELQGCGGGQAGIALDDKFADLADPASLGISSAYKTARDEAFGFDTAAATDCEKEVADLAAFIEAQGWEYDIEGLLALAKAALGLDTEMPEITVDGEKKGEAETLVTSSRVITEKTELSEAASIARTAFQCYLVHNLEHVKTFHKDRMRLYCGFGEDAWSESVYYKDKEAGQTYESEPRVILIDDADPDSNLAATNRLTALGKTGNFDTIKPHEVAQLMPSLRIYKIYRSEGKEVSKVELEFERDTNLSFMSGFNNDKTSVISESTFAKGTGFGVTSFNWSYIGGDPFTATRDLSATLNLSFQDFRSLVEPRLGTDLFSKKSAMKDYRYVDLVLQPDCRDPEQVKADNIEHESSSNILDYGIYRPECYEIAVEVGYTAESIQTLPSPVREMMQKQYTTLYLTVVEHTFDIKQDGTFNLSIEFKARLAALMGDKGMNVLVPGGGGFLEADFTETDPGSPERQEMMWQSGGKLLFDMHQLDQMIKTERKSVDADETEGDMKEDTLWMLEKLRSQIVGRSKGVLHAGIMASLQKQELIYKTTLDQKTFNRFAKFSRFNRHEDKITFGALGDPAKIVSTGHKDDPETTAKRIELSANPEAGDEALIEAQKKIKATAMNPKESFDIYFTTFGDLLGVITEHTLAERGIFLGNQYDGLHATGQEEIGDWLSGINPRVKGEDGQLERIDGEELAKVLLAGQGNKTTVKSDRQRPTPEASYNQNETNRLDPAKAEMYENFRVLLGCLVYKDVQDEKKKCINLAHLPISLEMLQQFLIDRVVSGKKTFYSYQDFCRDVLNDIVLKSMRNVCFGGYFKNTGVKAGVSLLNSIGTADDQEPIVHNASDGIYADNSEGTYKVLKLGAATSSKMIFPAGKNNRKSSYNYLMFSAYSLSDFGDTLTGKKENDAEIGIPHFQFGSAQGFLKSAQFSKTPLEYAAEERYVKEGSANMLNQLAGRYEMQMTMIGNNLFIPGQYVYFDPVAMGVGRPNQNEGGDNRSFANRMGLGGYHIITEVGQSISPGKFETILKTLWETSGGKAPIEAE